MADIIKPEKLPLYLVIKQKIKEIFKCEFVQELLFAGLGCLTFILIYSLLPRTCWDEIYRNIICAIIVISFFFVFLIFNQTHPQNNFFKINYKRNIVLFTVLNFAILSFLFFRTDFAYSGLSTDNWYRFAFVTRMSYSGYPQDFVYRGYSAFIAPLYWYILALIAKVFQIEPYKMVKYGFLFAYYFLPILLFEVWKKIIKQKESFYVTAFFFTFVANFYEIVWIDHLISFMFLIPFIIYYIENYKEKDFKNKDYIIAGLIGSILFCTFYLYFVLIPIYLIISLLQHKMRKNLGAFKETVKRTIYISILIAIFSSWFWIPLLINIVFIGYESHQNNFFPNYALDMPFDAYLKFNIFSLFLIIGILFIVLKYGKNRFLTILGNLVISIYILYFLGFICLLVGFPIVHYRLLIISYYVLIISFVLFYFEFFRTLKKQNIFQKLKGNLDLKKVEILFLIVIIFYQNYDNTVTLYKSDYYKEALNDEVPVEVKIIKQIDDYEDKVFLTQYYEVTAFIPVYLFIPENSHFSHPSALHNKRVKFLQELADSKNSEEFYESLLDSKFGPIHYFYLEPNNENSTEYLFDTVELDQFPERLNVKIYFRAELFEDSRYFKKLIIDGDIIYKTKY